MPGQRLSDFKAIPFLIRLVDRFASRFEFLQPAVIETMLTFLCSLRSVEVAEPAFTCFVNCQSAIEILTDCPNSLIMDNILASLASSSQVSADYAAAYWKSRGIEPIKYDPNVLYNTSPLLDFFFPSTLQNIIKLFPFLSASAAQYRLKPSSLAPLYSINQFPPLDDKQSWQEVQKEVSEAQAKLFDSMIPGLMDGSESLCAADIHNPLPSVVSAVRSPLCNLPLA